MHPGRATNESERLRRNALMAQVNLAYERGDQKAIEKLVSEYGQDPDVITGGDVASRLVAGNPGDVRAVGEGVSELRIDYGPGYRVYFTKRGREVVILLAGGDKTTQSADIKAALHLSRNL